MTKSNKVHRSFLPNLCDMRVLFPLILVAELIAITLSLNTLDSLEDFLFNLAIKSLFIQWIALLSAGCLCGLQRLTQHQDNNRVAIFAYLIVLLITLITAEATWLIYYALLEPISQLSYFSPQHQKMLLQTVGITSIIAAILLRYLYLQHQRQHNIEIVAHAQFQALQARIRPHFLFNCMNTIASLIRTQPRAAEQVVEDLSDLFRISLRDSLMLFSLAEEIALCKAYLQIEQYRLGDRLNVEWYIDKLPHDATIPPLTLQPLIENAINHGIERHEKGGTIYINGQHEQGTIRIELRNPLPTTSTKHDQGLKFAQQNIKKRLQAVYGEAATLETRLSATHYNTTLSLPYRKHEHPDRR